MTKLLIFPAVMIFVVLATALWGMIVDRTVHRPPSEWLASVYLGALVGLLGTGAMFLDDIQLHPAVAAVVALVVATIVTWGTIVLWSRIKRLDVEYYARRPGSIRGHVK